jgi:hypothetical protein
MEIRENAGLREGEVVIQWIQLMPRGSFGKWMTMLAIAIGAVIGGAVSFYNWGLGSVMTGVLIGCFAGLWVRGAAFKNTEQDRAIAQRPIGRKVRATGGVVWEDVDELFYFAWRFTTPGGERLYYALPIDAFETFETRTSNELMAGQHERADYHDSNIILVDHPDYGPVVVAAHIGPLADLAQLHAVLSKYVLAARQIAKKHRKRAMTSIEAAPDMRSDLPSSL